MRGCLSLPFRLLTLALLVLAGYVAWTYRGEIRHRIHSWTADPSSPPAARSRVGRPPDTRALMQRIDALRTGADSVVLSPADLAGLAAELAGRVAPGAVDSVEVRLDRDDIEVRARVDTHKIPVSLGPLSGVMRDHEYLEAGGRLEYRRGGLAEWHVQRVRVRGLPVPISLIKDQLRRFGPGAGSSGIDVALPAGVTGLRVMPTGVTLYGRERPRRGR